MGLKRIKKSIRLDSNASTRGSTEEIGQKLLESLSDDDDVLWMHEPDRRTKGSSAQSCHVQTTREESTTGSNGNGPKSTVDDPSTKSSKGTEQSQT